MEEVELVAALRSAGCVFAEEEAALLLEAADGDLDALVARRVSGEPLEYVVGWAEFCGLRVGVVPGVFVPRRRTEALVDRAVAARSDARVVVDLCCGSGALGLAFAARVPGIELHAADIDPRAVACARANLAAWSRPTPLVPRAARPPGGGIHVHEGDLFDALPDTLRGRVDVLLANTPYVPTDEIALLPGEARDHEPGVTLDGGPDGLGIARRVAAGAGDWLGPGGVVLVETSGRQAPALAAAFGAAGLAPRVVLDEEREAHVVVGRAGD